MQQHPYKGVPARPWIQVRFAAQDGSTLEIEMLADTGNPCSLIIGRSLMANLQHKTAPNVNTNFGLLEGGWVHLNMPDLGLDADIVAFASDSVVTATQLSCPDFQGLAGLPFLRLLEYGGDANTFWLRAPQSGP